MAAAGRPRKAVYLPVGADAEGAEWAGCHWDAEGGDDGSRRPEPAGEILARLPASERGHRALTIAESPAAALFAAMKHSTQLRKHAAASPYIYHPLAVAEVLEVYGRGRE